MDTEALSDLWEDLNMDRREEATKAIFDYMIANFDRFENMIYMEILPILQDAESEDMFGTEGANV